MEANKQQGSLSLDLFFGLIKLGMTAYFIYHFIGWMTFWRYGGPRLLQSGLPAEPAGANIFPTFSYICDYSTQTACANSITARLVPVSSGRMTTPPSPGVL